MKKMLNELLLLSLLMTIGYYSFGQQEKKKGSKSDPNVPIFEIKNDLDQTVFAVYPGGVKIFVEDQLKAVGAGFTVGRLSTGKASAGDILTVTPNNVNIIIDDGTGVKAAGGGFTVGRLSTGKAGGPENFLNVSPDSTRIYTNESSTKGFAVGKLSANLGSEDFLNITPDNYFIGHNVAPNISTGKKNSVLGYYGGYSLKTGYNNIFIGDSAGYNNISGHDNLFIGNRTGWKTTGNENIFIGNEAGYNSLSPVRNIFIGYQAGRKNLNGQYNVYLGDRAGTEGGGYYNTVLGAQAASTNNFGNGNVVIGYVAGRDMVSTNNVYLGVAAGYNNTGTVGGNVFIGYYAGEALSTQDNRLAISNRTPGNPLIYGEFDNHSVVINGTNPNSYNFYVSGTAGGSSSWNSLSDMRLKTNILTISSALQKVLQLRGVSFDWKDPNVFDDKKHIGFLAQEVEKVIPEVVNNKGDNYSMQYAPITALLVEAIKEQQQEIETLKQKAGEIDALKAEILELKALIKNSLIQQAAEKSESED